MLHVCDESGRSRRFIWQRRPSWSWGLSSSVWAVSTSRVAQRRRRRWTGRHTVSVFLVVAALTLASVFLTAALTYATLSACD